MSEAIVVILILLMLLLTVCLYKILDKRGLYFTIIILSLITFVFSFKIAIILKMNINLAIIPFTGLLTVLYLFIIKYGQTENKDLIKMTLYTNITLAVLLALMNHNIPAVTETISINMQETFEYNYKIILLYPIFITITEYLAIKLFDLINSIQTSIILSSILTYIILGIFFPIGLYLLVYIGILKIKYSLFIGISTYIIGVILTIINAISLNIISHKKVI